MTFLNINLISQKLSRTNLAIIKFWSVLWQEDVEHWLVGIMMAIFFIDSIIASHQQSSATDVIEVSSLTFE